MDKENKELKDIENIDLKNNKWSSTILLIIGGIILYYVFFNLGGGNDKQDYAYCVEDCARELDSCISRVSLRADSNRYDYESCSNDLDYCVSDCESDYLK